MRLIDADATYELARTDAYYGDFRRSMADLTSLKELLDDAPTIDPAERINKKQLEAHGKWVLVKNQQGYTTHANCSHCGYVIISSVCETPICPSCNAHMDNGNTP